MKSETEGQRARRWLRALIIDDIFNIDIQQAAALGCTNLHVHCAAAECGVCSKRCRSVGVCVCEGVCVCASVPAGAGNVAHVRRAQHVTAL